MLDISKFPVHCSGPEELEQCYAKLRLFVIKGCGCDEDMEQKLYAAVESVSAVLNTVEAKLKEVESELETAMEESRRNADKLGWLRKVNMKTAQIEIYQEKAVLATLKFNALKDKIDRKDELYLSQKGLQPIGDAAKKIRALEKERDQIRWEFEQKDYLHARSVAIMKECNVPKKCILEVDPDSVDSCHLMAPVQAHKRKRAAQKGAGKQRKITADGTDDELIEEPAVSRVPTLPKHVLDRIPHGNTTSGYNTAAMGCRQPAL